MGEKRTVFLSYCWKDEEIANEIDSSLNTKIQLRRDTRDVKYRNSIREFMESIRETDFVIMVISDNYLKSGNCMYEVLETMKNLDYRSRILPVVVDSSVFDISNWIQYINFWEEKHDRLKDAISYLDITNSKELVEELKRYRNVAQDIGEFLSIIRDMNCLAFETHQKSNFKDIMEAIGLGYSEIPILVEDVLRKQLRFHDDFQPKDSLITTHCQSCGTLQNLNEARVYKDGSETIYECKLGCQPILIVGLPGDSPWEGRGYRLGEFVIRNPKDLFVQINQSGKMIVLNSRVNALAKKRNNFT